MPSDQKNKKELNVGTMTGDQAFEHFLRQHSFGDAAIMRLAFDFGARWAISRGSETFKKGLPDALLKAA